MSIDFSNKKFGDKIYRLKASFNAFHRRKEYKVDENGVEWFRYIKERHDFDYEVYEYCGYRDIKTTGEGDEFLSDTVDYFLKCEDNIDVYDENEKFSSTGDSIWYENLDELLKVITKLREIDIQIDRN